MECRPICRFLLLLLCMLIEEVGIEIKIFEPYISACILGGAMKLSIKVLKLQLALETCHKTIFQSLIYSFIRFKGQSSVQN